MVVYFYSGQWWIFTPALTLISIVFGNQMGFSVFRFLRNDDSARKPNRHANALAAGLLFRNWLCTGKRRRLGDVRNLVNFVCYWG
jgi:hypothetical protein